MKRYEYLAIEVVAALFVITVIAQPCWSAVYRGTGPTDPNLALLPLTNMYCDGTGIAVNGGADAGDPNTTLLINSAFLDGNFNHNPEVLGTGMPPMIFPSTFLLPTGGFPPVTTSVWIMDLGAVYNIHNLIFYAGSGDGWYGMARTVITVSLDHSTWTAPVGTTPGVINWTGSFPVGTTWTQSAYIWQGVTGRYIKITASNWQSSGLEKLDQLDLFVTLSVRTCADLWASGGGYAADINHDCKVDFKDLAILTQEWLKCNIPGNASCEITWP